MTGEREHFFLDLYCTEDKVTLQVQTSSGTYQAIDPEKIYDVLAPHFPIEWPSGNRASAQRSFLSLPFTAESITQAQWSIAFIQGELA